MPIFSVVLVTAPPFTPGADAAASLGRIDGREALLRSVELFLNRDEVKQVQLIVPIDLLEEIKRKHGAHLGFSGASVIGGAPRFGDQIAAAAPALAAECTHVLVHDAARPCVPYTDIEALTSAASGKAAIAALSLPLRAGLVQLDEGGDPVGLLHPGEYAQLVTPLMFTRAKFLELASAKREPHASELSLIKGSPLNVRLSSSQEASFVKAMLSMLPKPKVRSGLSPFDEAQW